MSDTPTSRERHLIAPHAPELTVFHAGACRLCRAEIGVNRTCAGAERIAFVDVALTSGGNVTPGLDRAAALARFHVRPADGVLALGAAGFAQLWLLLPGWRWLGRIVNVPAVSALAETAYRAFLIVRPSLQGIACRVSPAQ